jgi:hypothetical protein
MRTKTKLLSALLGLAGSLSLMAQSTNVYSLNAVGYINVTCYPGFNLIACQLNCSPNNEIGVLMNNTNGVYNDASIYKWTGLSYQLDSGDGFDSNGTNGWNNNGTMTLNPGEALWFQNGDNTNITITFVGTVPQGTLTNTILNTSSGAGFNMISSLVPQGGDLCTNLGLTNEGAGDAVYVYNNNGSSAGYTVYNVDGFGPGNGIAGSYLTEWDSPGDPQVTVGQGFWYQVSSGNPVPSWIRTFSVNQ